MTQQQTDSADWRASACILCESNCGVSILVGEDGRTFDRIRGDQLHPSSRGYTCNKALRLDHYQNGRTGRITAPLRRRKDGTFEQIDWKTAIREVAAGLGAVRDTHGGASIFYYGGGGQGNHLGGAYAGATLAAFGSRFRSNALAQEKTGEFWVNARMLGSNNRADVEHCEVAVFVGKNPYQSHGFPRARAVLKDISKDPQRSMVVIDPVRTETAELADFHLQVRPGTDIHLLSALAAVLVQEDLIAHDWLAEHADGLDAVKAVLEQVPIDRYCEVSGVPVDDVRAVARRIAGADSVAVMEDLGVQMNRDSTLVSYVEKLVWLLTGNLGKEGAQYLFSSLGAGFGRDRGLPAGKGRRSPVVGAPIISGLVPANVIADEILTDHPDRYRAMIVESANPAHSLADSVRMRAALEALELVVVIDVAMTETARLADYILPAPTQYEKFEATFFNFEFPRNVFHLRHPVVEAPAGVLPEPEIHARLVEAAGALGEADYAPLRHAWDQGKASFATAFLAVTADSRLAGLAPVLLYRTLGPTLAGGAAAAAALWPAAHECARRNPVGVRRAGYGEGVAAGERLFEAILTGTHGVVITDDEQDATWDRLKDGKVHLDLPELLAQVADLANREPRTLDAQWPFVLSAGERRPFTANTIMRDPSWRRRDTAGALRMSTADAARLGLRTGDRARLSTRQAGVVVSVEVTETMRPGHLSLPNGFGLSVEEPEGSSVITGVAANELTATEDRDEWVGTPWHKHVPARLDPLTSADTERVEAVAESIPR